MSDKRKVATDALETLGTIITDGERDAIHLAVEPVIAGEVLRAGQDIGIVNGKAFSNAPKKLGIVDPFIKGSIKIGDKFWLVVYPRQITSLRHVWSHPDFEEKKSLPSEIDVHDAIVKLFNSHNNSESKEEYKAVLGPPPVKRIVSATDEEAVRGLPPTVKIVSFTDEEVFKKATDVQKSREWITAFAINADMEYDELIAAAYDYQRNGEYYVGGDSFEGKYVSEEFWDHFEKVQNEKVESRGNFFSCSC